VWPAFFAASSKSAQLPSTVGGSTVQMKKNNNNEGAQPLKQNLINYNCSKCSMPLNMLALCY